jgi:hypothetical protein
MNPSLLLIPDRYKAAKLYSQIPDSGAGDLTFARNSNATRVNSAGLIEKVRTNVFTHSEQFDNAAWDKVNMGVTANSAANPLNGASTAENVVPNTTLGGHYISQTQSVTAGVPFTISVYAKGNGYDWIYLFADGSGSGQFRLFDVTNGTLGTSGGTATSTITSVGNGWYRCTMSWIPSNSAALIFQISVLPSNSTSAFTGNGTSGALLYAAQLETGDIATDYIPTTTAAVSVGITANIPRLDYTGGGCPSLLLEPQRTNVALNSETFVLNTGTTVTLNNTASPDGFVSADKIVEDTSTGTHISNFTGILGGSVDSSPYSVSVFAKAAGRTRIRMFDNNQVSIGDSEFNISTGVVISGTGKIENYGNGWFRCTIFPLKDFLTTSDCRIQLLNAGGNNTYTGDGTSGVFLWGKQTEAGSYATSYIPTLGSSVTRLADTYQKANFGNTSTAGTLYYEFDNFQPSNPANGLYMIQLFAGSSVGDADFSDANSISIINNIAIEGRNNGYATTLFSFTPTAGATVKVALRYDGTNVVAFLNGVKQTVFADTAVGVKNAIRVNNGENGTQATRTIAFYPVALSDADCLSLTTL